MWHALPLLLLWVEFPDASLLAETQIEKGTEFPSESACEVICRELNKIYTVVCL